MLISSISPQLLVVTHLSIISSSNGQIDLQDNSDQNSTNVLRSLGGAGQTVYAQKGRTFYLKKLLYRYKLNLIFKSSCIFVLRQWCSCFGHTIRCFHRDLSNYECYYECFSDWFILSLLNYNSKHLIVFHKSSQILCLVTP